MKIQYQYKGRTFDDVREVTENERLVPKFDYILNEYIPFQVFITGRTFYKGLKVVPSFHYDPDEQYVRKILVKDLLKEQKEEFYFDKKEGLNEGVADAIGPLTRHFKIELNEEDFVSHLDRMPLIFGVPIGGMGSIMEYVTLEKVFHYFFPSKITHVLFGNGGDEIFLGYFFNQLILNFQYYSRSVLRDMTNFLSQYNQVVPRMVDRMIISSINRGGFWKSNLMSFFEYTLESFPDTISKLLNINVNYTLPSLLHLNQQMCRSLGVSGINPFSSDRFLSVAHSLNKGFEGKTRPKELLRHVDLPLPDAIRNGKEKKGFPIPFYNWPKADRVIGEEYKEFGMRKGLKELPPYKGINRFSWAVAQANIFLKYNERKRSKGTVVDPQFKERGWFDGIIFDGEREENMKVQGLKPSTNTFIGWYPWGKSEILGLFQKTAEDVWWFSGPGPGMSFEVDISKARMMTWEEFKDRVEIDWASFNLKENKEVIV